MLVKTLRSEPRWMHKPVLFLSSSDNPSDRLKGFRVGADDFIPKSSAMEEILIRLDQVKRKHHIDQVQTHTYNQQFSDSGLHGRISLLAPRAILELCHQNRFLVNSQVKTDNTVCVFSFVKVHH